MLSKACTFPQTHLSSFLQSEKKIQLDTYVETSQPNGWGWAEECFLGLFQIEKIMHLSLCTTKRVTHWENSPIEEEKETQSLLESGQSEKRRTSLRGSLIGDLKQTKLEDAIWCIFFYCIFFFVSLSTRNSKHNLGNWMLQTGSEQIVLNDSSVYSGTKTRPTLEALLSTAARRQCVLLS